MLYSQLVAGTAPQASPAPLTARLVDVDPDVFRARFNRIPYLVGHRLVGHPLFELPRLVELARSLPEKYVEYYAGNAAVSQDWHLTPRNGLSVVETIRRIEEHCSWMVLKRVDQDLEYTGLLEQILDEVAALSEPLDPGMCERAGAVFISSPGAVTPYHMDQEYNFLFQLRGGKTIHVFDAADPTILSEQELEAHFTRASIDRNLVFHEEYEKKASVFALTAGHALHIPSLHPHWVQNGNGVSISFSAGFDTAASIRKAELHALNHRLRRLGLRPTEVGQAPLRDWLKHAAFRACKCMAKLWGGRKGG
jgi:hypothetical protein